jgi:hypothetical protein
MTSKRIYAGIGARNTPPDILDIMRFLADKLEDAGWLLRSGGASGADSAFESGVKNPSNKCIYLPGPSFNGKVPGKGYFDSTVLPGWKHALMTVDEFHPNPSALSDFARKLMARNAMQVFGPTMESPAEMIIAWTLDGEIIGGTGQALRMAEGCGVTVHNLGNAETLENIFQILGLDI